MDSELVLLFFSRLMYILDDILIFGSLSHIKSFIRELALGGLSSFSTEEKFFFFIVFYC